MKTHWKRLAGALVVLAIGLVAFTPALTMQSGASLSGAAGRRASGPSAAQLSVADAALG